jgi:hypothetical protein
MRFLVDECTGPAVAQRLRAQTHVVFSVYDEARGLANGSIFQNDAHTRASFFFGWTTSAL